MPCFLRNSPTSDSGAALATLAHKQAIPRLRTRSSCAPDRASHALLPAAETKRRKSLSSVSIAEASGSAFAKCNSASRFDTSKPCQHATRRSRTGPFLAAGDQNLDRPQTRALELLRNGQANAGRVHEQLRRRNSVN